MHVYMYIYIDVMLYCSMQDSDIGWYHTIFNVLIHHVSQ